MNRNADITDEMIARYLSGKVTPEEASAVLDYTAESDEHLDDFLAMSAAIEQFENSERTTKEPTRVRLLWPAISVAASIILFLCIGLPFLQQSPSGSNIGIDHAPSYATTDTMIDIEMEDCL